MRRLLTLLAALFCAASCGQTGGGSGSLAEGGIGGTGISTGPITAFGSIFVNDIEWFLDDSEIEVDGEDGSEEILRLGMVVRVEGEIDRDAGTGQATKVYFDDELEGPVSQVAEVTDIGIPGQYRRLTVLGMEVLIEAGVTRFRDDEDENSDFGFNTIEAGDVVEISGLVDHEGVVRATFVEREGDVVFGETEVEIKGTVSGLATGGSTFMIGSITVEFDPTQVDTDLSGLPGEAVDNGMFVEVEGVLNSANTIFAEEIELEDEFDDDDAENFSITGYVHDFASLELFFVGGQEVDASGAEFEHGTSSMLEEGRRVEVEGDIVDGVLIADEVEFEDQEVRIYAEIAAAEDIDVALGRLVLLGAEVQILPSTQFEDKLGDEESILFGDLAAGDFVEVEGVANAQGVVTAFEIERRETDTVRLRGPVSEFNAGTGEMVILGVRVATASSTDFEIEDMEVGSGAFFAQLKVGDFVEANDDTGSATVIDVATEVELENE